MEYLAFALKYRPQNFDEVIGQVHVVLALKNAILNNRVHHAYLFSGPRGIGKTSIARILAKALNCSEGPTISPCGKCPSCREITKGVSLDVIEIDGASNRGIDEIRALRESVKLVPAGARYKIYIIDEVHMLTQEAFNALLKTLEEPPSHVKFIFATTLPQKVLPTILSRCQKFQFNLLPVEKIVDKMEAIVNKENLDIDKNLLYSIARCAQGSIRDAESLLDQMVPIILDKGQIKEIISFLGIIDEDSLNTMAKFIIEKNLPASLDFIQKLIDDGKDLGVFLNGLIEYIKNIIIAQVSLKTFKSLSHISPHTKSFILKISELITTPEVLKVIDLLIEAKDLSKKLNSLRIPLELAIIKFSSPTLKIQEVPKSASNSYVPLHTDTEKFDKDEDFDMDIEDKDVLEEENLPKGNKPPYDKSLTLEEIAPKWLQIISDIGKIRVSLATYLCEAALYSFDEGVLKIAFPKKYAFHKEIVESTKNLKFIEDFLVKYLGKNIGIKFILLEEKEQPQDEPPKDHQEKHGKDENDFLNELLDTFKGKIHTENE